MKEALAYALVAGMSAALLWHFSLIVRFGSFTVQEPKMVILTLEIILLLACLIFAVAGFVKLLLQRRER